mgnify:CR=1 FL=1
MIVVATAVALPVVWAGGQRHREGQAFVLGGAVLGGGVGLVGLGLISFFEITEGFQNTTARLAGFSAVLPVVAAPIALLAVLRPRLGRIRGALLVCASVISLAGAPTAVVFSIGGLTAVLSGLCYLVGLGSPRALIRKFDPRL